MISDGKIEWLSTVGKVRRVVQGVPQRIEVSSPIGFVRPFVLAIDLTAISAHGQAAVAPLSMVQAANAPTMRRRNLAVAVGHP
jgi:hypothetical protein